MNFAVYYILCTVVNIVFVILFRVRIIVNAMSAVPAFLMGLSTFQAAYFHHHRSKKDFNTNNNSDFTEREWERISVYMRNAYLISVPIYIPFIVFFSSGIKLLSFVVFVVSFTGGIFYYRIRFKDALKARFSKEDRELEEQRKREALGKWK